MSRIVATVAASFENVIRVHSSAIWRADSSGFQARRPEAYQFDCEK